MSDDELDSFVRLEKELAKEVSLSENSYSDDSPSSDFENLQDFKQEYTEILKSIDQKTRLLEKAASKIAREKKNLKLQREEFAKEKVLFESEKLLSNVDIDEQFGKLSNKYNNLQDRYINLQKKYSAEKQEWESERKELLKKIEEQTNIIQSLKEQQSTPINKQNSPKKNSPQKPPSVIELQLDESDDVVEEVHPVVSTEVPANNSKSNQSIISGQDSFDSLPEPTGGIIINVSSASKPKTSQFTLNHDEYQLNFQPRPTNVVKEVVRKDKKKALQFDDGTNGILFTNNSLKIERGNCIFIYYQNGDISQEFPDGTIGYKYKDKNIIELNLADGSVFYEFPNGQKEKHLPNGDKYIQFPGCPCKLVKPNGESFNM